MKDKEDGDVKSWAENIISTNFKCLQTSETVGYWSSLAITSSSKEDVITADTLKFKITTVSNYNKRRAADTTANPRKHIAIADNDNVILDGLGVSLFSHLKTVGANKMHNFADQSEKEQYYISITMNNVLDLSNQDDNCQLSSLSRQQIESLNNKYKFEEPPQHFVDSFREKMKESGNNIKHSCAIGFFVARMMAVDKWNRYH